MKCELCFKNKKYLKKKKINNILTTARSFFPSQSLFPNGSFWSSVPQRSCATFWSLCPLISCRNNATVINQVSLSFLFLFANRTTAHSKYLRVYFAININIHIRPKQSTKYMQFVYIIIADTNEFAFLLNLELLSLAKF